MFRCIGSSGAGTLGGSVWDRAAELFASRQGCASEQSTRPRWPGRCSTQGEPWALSLGTRGLGMLPGEECGAHQLFQDVGRGENQNGVLPSRASAPDVGIPVAALSASSTAAPCSALERMEVRPGSLRPFRKGLYRDAVSWGCCLSQF